MNEQRRVSKRFKAGFLPEPEKIKNFIEETTDVAVLVDGSGIVKGINVNPEVIALGSLNHWVGSSFSSLLTEESQAKFTERMRQIEMSDQAFHRPIEINHRDQETWGFPMRYTVHSITGSDAVLLIGRDMQPIAEVQQRLVNEQLGRDRDQQKKPHQRSILSGCA